MAFAPQSRITKAAATGVIDCLKAIRANSAFRIFLGAYSLTGLGYGVYYATAYLFLDGYLGIPDKFPLIATITAVSQLVAIPILTRLAQRIERHRMWAIGIGVYGLLLPLRLLIPVGEHGLPFLIGLVVIENIANAASQVPQMAMLADCVDFGALRSRSNMAGSYYAVQQFILKGALAAGGAVAFFALGALHYEAKAKVHSASSLMGLGLVHTLGPLVLFSCAALLLWAFPLNRRRQGVVRRRLDGRLASAD